MAKNKGLPPLSNPKPATLIDKEGKPVGMSLPHHIYVDVKPVYDHCCKFCNETSFDLLSLSMQSERWELVSVVPHRKYVSTGGGNGYSDGWMTFWKRIRINKDEK